MELPNAFAILKTSAKRKAKVSSPDGQASASIKRKSTGESTRTVSRQCSIEKIYTTQCRHISQSAPYAFAGVLV